MISTLWPEPFFPFVPPDTKARANEGDLRGPLPRVCLVRGPENRAGARWRTTRARGTAGSPRSLSVRVPDGARAGDTMRIYHGVTGEVFSCAVPPGGEGQTLVVPI